MSFPVRTYTREEVQLARSLINDGFKHNLKVFGGREFRTKAKNAVRLVRIADYYDFLRAYIRSIREIDGLSQLREEEASIWTNMYLLEDSVEASSFFIQKACQMKFFLEDKVYYGHDGEKSAIDSRIDFLRSLEEKSEEMEIKEKCRQKIEMWEDSKFL